MRTGDSQAAAQAQMGPACTLAGNMKNTQFSTDNQTSLPP